MNKLISVIICSLALSCASHEHKPIQQPQQVDYNPSNMDYIIEQDRKRQEQDAIRDEYNAYLASLDRIEKELRDEGLRLVMCREVYKDGIECYSMLKRLCEIDALIDTRNGYHYKSYCRQLGRKEK